MVQNKMYSSQVFMKDAEMEQKQLHKVVYINQQLETGPEYCWMQPLCIKLLVLFLILILLHLMQD